MSTDRIHPFQFIALINAHGILIVASKLSLTNRAQINDEFILSPIDQENYAEKHEGHGKSRGILLW